MVNKITTATVIGLNAYEVCLETDVQNGLPSFSIVGLPDTAITEARDRVRSAVKNSGFSFPAKKIIINLAPADLKKVGTSFDLPIAIGLIIEEGILEVDKTKDYAFIGELSLNGDLRSVNRICDTNIESSCFNYAIKELIAGPTKWEKSKGFFVTTDS